MWGEKKSRKTIIRSRGSKSPFFKTRLGKTVRALIISSLFFGAIAYLSLYFFNRFIQDKDEGLVLENVVSQFETGSSNEQLVAYALKRTQEQIIVDENYPTLTYPNGDIPLDRGMDIDLIIRAYRQIGFDFQQAIHEDIVQNFEAYPKLWDLQAPNPSVDHRRSENLLHYLTNHGTTLPSDIHMSQLRVGDIVVWRLASAKIHIGFLAPVKNTQNQESFWVIHNFDRGPVWSNDLHRFAIINFHRFTPPETPLKP